MNEKLTHAAAIEKEMLALEAELRSKVKKFMAYDRSIGSVWYIASPYTHDDEAVVAKRVDACERAVKIRR